jgi:hypothetical protein
MPFDYLPPITCESARPSQEHPRPWRNGSVFDHGGEFHRPISTKSRALVMDRAEALERRTKAPGKRHGVLGQSALMILRALLFHFLDSKSGRLDPSYQQIHKQTGFCVQTIAVALKRLERAGILDITRRIVRKAENTNNARPCVPGYGQGPEITHIPARLILRIPARFHVAGESLRATRLYGVIEAHK